MKWTQRFFIGCMVLSLPIALFGIAKENAQQTAPKNAAVSHKTRQTRPIQLGVSGGSIVDLANGYCCSGTLGCLVKDSLGTQYILSNTHVFAGDTVPGGNGKVSAVGDPINQPGYVDVQCHNLASDYVAHLSAWSPLVPNGTTTVDAAIAQVIPGKVDSTGRILEIGTISNKPLGAKLKQKVKKSGRTSGLTQGSVYALNASVVVSYTNECAGQVFTTTLNNQILVTPGSFIQPGDSGSLMVENVSKTPRPIGLLYAGSSSIAVAMPIQTVLNQFSVTIVGMSTPELEETLLSQEVVNAFAIQEKYAEVLMRVENAVGHAVTISENDPSCPVIVLLVEKVTEAVLEQAPKMVDGLVVEIKEVGKLTAYPCLETRI